jgi:hypothetical protein
MCEVEKIEHELLKKLNKVEAEKESLCVFDVYAVLDSLKVDNSLLLSKISRKSKFDYLTDSSTVPLLQLTIF